MRYLAQVSAVAAFAAAFSITGCSLHGSAAPQPGRGSGAALSGPLVGSPDTGTTPILYVAQYGSNAIQIYDQAGTNQSPIGTLTSSLSGPWGLFVTGTEDLYVANLAGADVVIFHKGATSPYKTLSDPGELPVIAVVDSTGTVYVANNKTTRGGPGSVSVYAGGSTTPTSRLTVPNNIEVLWCALNNHHNLFVGYYKTNHTNGLVKFVGGAGTAKSADVTIQFPGQMEFDSAQDLVFADENASTVNVYELPTKTPVAQYATPSGGTIVGLALTKRSANFYVSDYGTGAVYEFSYPAGVLVDTISTGLGTSSPPTGVATDPSAPL